MMKNSEREKILNTAKQIWKDSGRPHYGGAGERFKVKYSVKPECEELKVRLFLRHVTLAVPEYISVEAVTFADNAQNDREEWRGFIQWLGDWQEISIKL